MASFGFEFCSLLQCVHFANRSASVARHTRPQNGPLWFHGRLPVCLAFCLLVSGSAFPLSSLCALGRPLALPQIDYMAPLLSSDAIPRLLDAATTRQRRPFGKLCSGRHWNTPTPDAIGIPSQRFRRMQRCLRRLPFLGFFQHNAVRHAPLREKPKQKKKMGGAFLNSSFCALLRNV